MPFTAGLGDLAQTELMLKLLSEEPHHTRVLAIRNAQDEELMIIPGSDVIREQLKALQKLTEESVTS